MTKAIAKTEDRALAPQQKTFLDLRSFLMSDRAQAGLKSVAAKHITPEKVTRLALAMASRQPDLAKCAPDSLLRALMDCAAIGAEPTGRYGGAYLVSRFNSKRGCHEAQAMTDYRFEIDLVCRSGNVQDVWPRIVYAREVETGRFVERAGSDPKLRHDPLPGHDDRGEMVAAYAVALFRSGHKRWRVLWKDEIEARRKRSRSGDRGPWQTDTQAMWLKTAVRALCSLFPISPEYSALAAREEAQDLGLDDQVIDVPEDDEEISPPESATERLTDRLKREQEAGKVVDAWHDEGVEQAPLGQEG